MQASTMSGLTLIMRVLDFLQEQITCCRGEIPFGLGKKFSIYGNVWETE